MTFSPCRPRWQLAGTNGKGRGWTPGSAICPKRAQSQPPEIFRSVWSTIRQSVLSVPPRAVAECVGQKNAEIFPLLRSVTCPYVSHGLGPCDPHGPLPLAGRERSVIGNGKKTGQSSVQPQVLRALVGRQRRQTATICDKYRGPVRHSELRRLSDTPQDTWRATPGPRHVPRTVWLIWVTGSVKTT